MAEVTFILVFVCLGIVTNVQGQENVALGKPVYQQSRHTSCWAIPTHATDGILDGVWSHHRCTGTAVNAVNPWLVVDLLDNATVTEVRIQHRMDASHIHFYSVGVAVGDAFDPNDPTSFSPSDLQECNVLPRWTGPNTLQTAECDPPVTGRYVALYMFGQSRHLTVCEVQVTAVNTSLIDVSTGKPTFGSSPFDKYYASFATDGNLDGLYKNRKGFYSKLQYRPWLAVELGRNYKVKFVVIKNTIRNKYYTGVSHLNNMYVATSTELKLDGSGPIVDLNIWSICGFFPGGYYGGEILAAQCEPVRQARYVILFLEAEEHLIVTELTVYALH